MMKKLITITLLFISVTTWAQLPSWGMTENQYKMPNFENKMGDIGTQAVKNNWLLKITAPQDWHNNIRTALSDSGARDVQMSFKDSVHQSIAITAAKGAKVAKISSSSSNTTVQKQVVIDKPEIDTEVEAPDFGDTNFASNNNELLENIASMEIEIPQAKVSTETRPKQPAKPAIVQQPKPVTPEPQPVVEPKTQPVVEPKAQPVVQTAKPVPAQPPAVETEAIKDELRSRNARNKLVDKVMSYKNITEKDDLFIQGPVVLIKRYVNQGVGIFFWMKEAYDPAIHKMVAKGSGKFKKDPGAVAGDQAEQAAIKENAPEPAVEVTELGFIAVDSDVTDQDTLRQEKARSKRVDLSVSAGKLKTDDILYVLNKTVLVEREIARGQSVFFWLVGDTTIDREVEQRGENRFIIR